MDGSQKSFYGGFVCRAVHTAFVTLQKCSSIIEALIHVLWAVVWWMC